MKTTAQQPEIEEAIAGMVQRIVERFHPEKIILFGSHARGDAGPDSDVDLLVVMPFEGSHREKQIGLRTELHDLPVAKDIIGTRPEEFAWRKEVPGTMEQPAVNEGRIVYERR
jgi:predicted nucleotidyltransferase